MLLWKVILSSTLNVSKALCSDIIHAIEPSCTTNAASSSSCNVGVNPILSPEDNTIDSGHQWVTVQESVTTISGTRTTKYISTFTATQTNFLTQHPITTTNEAGAAIITTTTEYVSFITSTPAAQDGGGGGEAAAAAAIIIGIIIAPALVESLQAIVDSAAGKTIEEIGEEIAKSFGKKANLSPGDIQLIARYAYAALGAAAGVGVVVYPLWMSNAVSATITSITAVKYNMTITTQRPTVTAIMKFPYDNWEEIYSAPPNTGTQLELPSDYTCNTGRFSIDPSHARELAKGFCSRNKVDSGNSANEIVSSTDDKFPLRFVDVSILFNFEFEDGQCELKCADAYNSLIKTCQYNSHTLNGNSSYEDICGTYSMSIQTTISSRPLFSQDCIAHTDGYIPFIRDQGIDAINRGCGINQSVTKHFTIFQGSVNITGTSTLSRDQDGCNPVLSNLISFEDCKMGFMAAMDNCDTETRSAKYGAKILTWSSSNGCIDFGFYGRKRH